MPVPLVARGAVPVTTERIAMTTVAVHIALTLAHGGVHVTVPVRLAHWQTLIVAIVLFGLPLAGALLVARGRAARGVLFLCFAGVAGVAFEGVFHFVVANPDHVASVPRLVVAFHHTAVLSTLGNLVLVAGGAWVARRS